MGPAGWQLDELLHGAGISRSECYFTNVIKVQPPGNKIEVYLDLKKKKPIETALYREHLAYLEEELSSIKTNLFVALGNVPLYALTGLKNITRRRGSLYTPAFVGMRKMLATVHPSGVMHQYLYRYAVMHDLELARTEAAFPELRQTKRNYIIKPSFTEAKAFLQYCMQCKLVAFDIELLNEEVSCISFSPAETESISIPFLDSMYRDYFTPAEEEELWLLIAQLLEDERIEKVAQNSIFDKSFLFKRYGILASPVRDTMIASGIIYPDLPKDLGFICSIYTDLQYFKDKGMEKKWSSVDEDFWLYSAKDSIVCRIAWPQQLEELKSTNNISTYYYVEALVEPLMLISERGMRMDVVGLRKARDDATEELALLEKDIMSIVGVYYTDKFCTSPKQLMDYFYRVRKLPPYKSRTTGKPTIDENALRRIARKGFKEAELLLNHRSISTLKSKYFTVALDDNGRLSGSYNPVGTNVGGRLSSSSSLFVNQDGEYIGTNLQNLPPQFLRFVLPDIDYTAYILDLSQAENRIVAYIAPIVELIRAFEDGMDVHRLTASFIFDKRIEDISDNKEEDPIRDGKLSERDWGKKANHAFNYGLGYRTFALNNQLREADAKRIAEQVHRAYPGIKQMHNWIQNELHKGRTLTNLYSRKRTFLDRWGDALFRQAYSYIPQSTVGDKINREAILYIESRPEEFKYLEVLNQVHDSIVFQIPNSQPLEYHASCLLLLKESLEVPLRWRNIEFSIPIECKTGPNLRDMEKVNLDASNLVEELTRIRKGR